MQHACTLHDESPINFVPVEQHCSLFTKHRPFPFGKYVVLCFYLFFYLFFLLVYLGFHRIFDNFLPFLKIFEHFHFFGDVELSFLTNSKLFFLRFDVFPKVVLSQVYVCPIQVLFPLHNFNSACFSWNWLRLLRSCPIARSLCNLIIHWEKLVNALCKTFPQTFPTVIRSDELNRRWCFVFEGKAFRGFLFNLKNHFLFIALLFSKIMQIWP